MTFQGATSHPLLSSFDTLPQDARWIIPAEAATLAARATWLGANDPFIAALYAAHVQGLMGPTGPRLNSLYDSTPDEIGTSAESRAMRRRINAISAASWDGREIDAENARTRYELECAIDHAAFFTGDGIAIRVAGYRSRWRLIHRDRVRNPGNARNSEDWRDGFKLAGRRVVGINVSPALYLMGDEPKPDLVDVYVEWTSADGTPNVLHKPGLRLPGMIRGVSRLSPLIVMQRQVGGVLESHIAAKRLQAIFGMIVEAEDADAWAEAVKNKTALDPANLKINGPLACWVKPPGSKVDFTDTKFNGQDLESYLTMCYKVECATLQMPIDVVLCQMGNASLSSARAGLDQFDRTCQTEQEMHIACVSSQLDRVEVADAVAYGKLDLQADDWSLIMAGKYSRPPKYSTDRKKDAETMKAYQEAGISKTTSLEAFGFSLEDETELKRAEAEFEKSQALPDDISSNAGSTPTPTPTDSGTQTPPAPEVQPAARAWWRDLFAFRK